MASLFIFITVMVMVAVNAFQAGEHNNNNDPFQGFSFGTQFQFPKISFPNIQIPTFKPFSQFPQFKPIIPKIKIPSPDDIINRKPRPGEMINSVFVKSASGQTVDENGKVIKTGGATIYTNINGETKEVKVGNGPIVEEGNVTPSQKEDIEQARSSTYTTTSTVSTVTNVNGKIEEYTLGIEKNYV